MSNTTRRDVEAALLSTARSPIVTLSTLSAETPSRGQDVPRNVAVRQCTRRQGLLGRGADEYLAGHLDAIRPFELTKRLLDLGPRPLALGVAQVCHQFASLRA
jgi:hypothetical protein